MGIKGEGGGGSLHQGKPGDRVHSTAYGHVTVRRRTIAALEQLDK